MKTITATNTNLPREASPGSVRRRLYKDLAYSFIRRNGMVCLTSYWRRWPVDRLCLRPITLSLARLPTRLRRRAEEASETTYIASDEQPALLENLSNDSIEL